MWVCGWVWVGGWGEVGVEQSFSSSNYSLDLESSYIYHSLEISLPLVVWTSEYLLYGLYVVGRSTTEIYSKKNTSPYM